MQYDPDSGSGMLQEIYKKLWNVNLKDCINKICGETMNSANTSINKFYNYLYGEEDLMLEKAVVYKDRIEFIWKK